MDTLKYIVDKYNIDLNKRSPFKIFDTRRGILPELFKELKFKIGVEVGVGQGRFSEFLCKNLPDLKLYGVDPWEWYPTFKNYRNKPKLDRSYKRTLERMASYKNYTIIKKRSMAAVKDFENGSLDFVFIDGDHRLQFVINDIAEWGRKVKVGGIISGHDFGRGKNGIFDQVEVAVTAWTYANKIHPWITFGHLKDNGWMWVKGELYDEQYS